VHHLKKPDLLSTAVKIRRAIYEVVSVEFDEAKRNREFEFAKRNRVVFKQLPIERHTPLFAQRHSGKEVQQQQAQAT
jgi:hypothetical protein